MFYLFKIALCKFLLYIKYLHIMYFQFDDTSHWKVVRGTDLKFVYHITVMSGGLHDLHCNTILHDNVDIKKIKTSAKISERHVIMLQ